MGGLVGAPAFNSTFNKPGPVMLGLIVSIMEVGAFLGSVTSSIFGEDLGRRKSLMIAVVIMMLGALLQATAYTRVHMIVARVVAGFGLGVSNSTAPVLQAEYSPKASRGLCKGIRFRSRIDSNTNVDQMSVCSSVHSTSASSWSTGWGMASVSTPKAMPGESHASCKLYSSEQCCSSASS